MRVNFQFVELMMYRINKKGFILLVSTGKRKSTNQCSSNLNTSSTSRLKYAAIRSINSADGARSPRSTLLIVFVQNPVAEAISSCRRPRDSRIVFRLLTTAMANTFLHTYLIIPRIQKILSKKKDLIIVDIL